MNQDINEIFEGTEYCTLATVCADSSPWNVPIRFAYDESNLYFRSPPGTVHGINIDRDNGRVSIVIVDTTQLTKGALYIHSNAQKLSGEEEQSATTIFKKRFNNPPDQGPVTEYFKVAIGHVDQTRSMARMYYFETRGES